MLNNLIAIDAQITNFINSLLPHNHSFNTFFSFFSLKGGSILIWLAIIIFLMIFEGKRDKRLILYFFISFLTTAFLVNIAVKNIVKRSRPSINTACPIDYSFPSGHAATAFAGAVVLSAFDKKRRCFYYFIASLIGVSRIYLGCHFFLDVFGGVVIGYVLGKIVSTFKNVGTS